MSDALCPCNDCVTIERLNPCVIGFSVAPSYLDDNDLSVRLDTAIIVTRDDVKTLSEDILRELVITRLVNEFVDLIRQLRNS